MNRPRTLLAAIAALALAGCGGGGEPDASDTAANTTARTSGGCRETRAPAPRDAPAEKPPGEILEADKTYRVAVSTNCGDFTITLDQKASPRAAASFASLVEHRYFDDTQFHRIVPGFVIQGGDPTASGAGGPGYTTVDPPAPNTKYTRGVVAMAKTAAEPPGAAGSQFFVVTADDAGLPPDYAVVGRVTDGLAVVERIGRLGDPGTEQPTQPVVIDEMTLDAG